MSNITEIKKKYKNYEMEDSILLKELHNDLLSIKKTEFELTQEKFLDDFANNIDKYNKKYDDEKIIFTMNNLHISLNQIFDIKPNKIELIQLDNEIINKILIELHNISMVNILFNNEKLDKNYSNSSDDSNQSQLIGIASNMDMPSHLDKDKVEWNNYLLLNYFSLQQVEQKSLYERKNSDYGDAYLLFGFIGIIVRIQDKIQRLISIINKKNKIIYNESILDTLIDLCNYCILALMVYNKD